MEKVIKRVRLRDSEVHIIVSMSQIGSNYSILFPKWFRVKIKGYGVSFSKNEILFKHNPDTKKRMNEGGTIKSKRFLRDLFERYRLPWGTTHFIASFIYKEYDDGVIAVTILIPQEVGELFPEHVLSPQNNVENGKVNEAEDDILARVKSDVLELKSRGVKCSFSYSVMREVTETL